jgi:hypothetical protein
MSYIPSFYSSHICHITGYRKPFYSSFSRNSGCAAKGEAGIDFKAIAGWLGHKDGGLLVAKTYGHLRDEHSAEMAKRMTYGA